VVLNADTCGSYRLGHSSSVVKFDMISSSMVWLFRLFCNQRHLQFRFLTMLQMVSASGDGVVKVWDTHMFVCVQVTGSTFLM
jgi:hypothetical protein